MTLKEQLVRDEGLRLKPYQDSVGKTTIGVGRNLTDVGISKAEAMLMLEADIYKAESNVRDALPWVTNLDEVRRSVLVNMCFNMGIGGLLGFRNTLALIKDGKYGEAAHNMLDSKWARQVGDRAKRLAEQMTTGEWR